MVSKTLATDWGRLVEIRVAGSRFGGEGLFYRTYCAREGDDAAGNTVSLLTAAVFVLGLANIYEYVCFTSPYADSVSVIKLKGHQKFPVA